MALITEQPAMHLCRLALPSGSIKTLKELVRHRYGYTLVPELAVLEEVETNLLLKQFVAPESVREVSMVVQPRLCMHYATHRLARPSHASVLAHLHASKATEKAR